MRFHKIEKGRYVLYLNDNYSNQIRFETSRTHNFGLGFNFQKEEAEYQISLYCFKLFSVWLSYENHNFKYRDDPIETGIVWNPVEHIVWIKLLSQKEMDSSKPAIIDKYWDYYDFFFGRSIYSESRHNELNGFMTLPERTYKMKCDFYTSYWHRPRSPFVRRMSRVEITPDIPVPIPGKGENSWDLDDDATHSSTMPVNGRTMDELIEDFKQSTLERRERYGGKNWVPTAV